MSYFNADLRGCAIIAACILLALGALLGWLVPMLWALIRPWLHAITG